MSRLSNVERSTSETEIEIEINLDDYNQPLINTPLPFFNHMLEQIGKHSGIALRVEGKGDVEVDSHHLVEDIGITMGKALDEAFDEKKGIRRYSSITLPFDETLVRTSLDISGRSYLDFGIDTEGDVEGFPMEVLPEYFRGLVQNAGLTLHFDQIKSGNNHHLAEAVFKSFARVLKEAKELVDDKVPSTKGTID